MGHRLHISQVTLRSFCAATLQSEFFVCFLVFASYLQDPNSKHLGTTVWDSSMVFAKFMVMVCDSDRAPLYISVACKLDLLALVSMSDFGFSLILSPSAHLMFAGKE
jgi:hypothetical protein